MAEEAVATAKVRWVHLAFATDSIQRCRAIQAITDGLARNKFIGNTILYNVPKELRTSVKHTLCNSLVIFF